MAVNDNQWQHRMMVNDNQWQHRMTVSWAIRDGAQVPTLRADVRDGVRPPGRQVGVGHPRLPPGAPRAVRPLPRGRAAGELAQVLRDCQQDTGGVRSVTRPAPRFLANSPEVPRSQYPCGSVLAALRPTSGCPTGLTLANLKIAEDRIPSLLAVFPMRREGQAAAPAGGFTTHWVRDAVCYFESEETLGKLCVQRRRWLNGTNMVCSSVQICIFEHSMIGW